MLHHDAQASDSSEERERISGSSASPHPSFRPIRARTAAILNIIATCIAHDVNPRAYLHLVTKLIVRGWPNSKLRELLPDRMLAAHPELYVGERPALSASGPAALVA